MRRYLFAITALLLVTASPAFAGYIIIRVLLEGGGAPVTPGTGPGSDVGPGMPPGPGPMRPGTSFTGPARPGTSLVPGMSEQPGVVVGPTVIDHTRAVVIIVPLETDFVHGKLDPARPKNDQTNPEYRKLNAPYYGRLLKSSLFVDSSTIQLYEDLIAQPAVKKTRGTEMREMYANWLRGKKDPQLLYDAMILALESGFIRETTVGKDGNPLPDAMKMAQELLDAAAEKKPLSAAAQRFVQAWGEMSKAVRAPAPQPSDAERWRSALDATNVRTDRHYSVIYWDSPDHEVIRRSNQLNDHFAAFYLWHATRGIVLPVPGKPFVVVLAPHGEMYKKLRKGLDGFDGLPAQTDGFFAPEHELLVLSSNLMDSAGITFQTQNQRYFTKGFSRDRLLEGQIPKIDANGVNGARPEDVARASTLAFVEKFVVDNAEIAAVSREGTRQLLFATGGLPKHVTLPNWLTQGALSFYTRPNGPAYVTIGDDDKPYMTVAFTTGYGVPNYVNQRYFRDLDAHKELNADRAKLLEHVLTDAYFTGLKDAIDPDPAPPAKKKPAVRPVPPGGVPMGDPDARPGQPFIPMAPIPGMPGAGAGVVITGDDEDPLVLQRRKRERLNIKSQATAWALYYYLARSRSAELQQYIAELNKLPRDLPIDGRTAHAAFVRVFKLSSTEDGQADPALMAKFARDWLDYMTTVPPVGLDVPLVVPEPPKTPPGGTPMGSMIPMGVRPGGNP